MLIDLLHLSASRVENPDSIYPKPGFPVPLVKAPGIRMTSPGGSKTEPLPLVRRNLLLRL